MNSIVDAGWSYWGYSYADKRSGDRVYQGWKTQAGSFCDHSLDGVTTYYSTPANCGYGGYLDAQWGWEYGNSSYIYLEAN